MSCYNNGLFILLCFGLYPGAPLLISQTLSYRLDCDLKKILKEFLGFKGIYCFAMWYALEVRYFELHNSLQLYQIKH